MAMARPQEEAKLNSNTEGQDETNCRKQTRFKFWRSLRNKDSFRKSNVSNSRPLHPSLRPSGSLAYLPRSLSRHRAVRRNQSSAHLTTNDSGYASLSSSPLPKDNPSPSSSPHLPRFSWQDRLPVESIRIGLGVGIGPTPSLSRCFDSDHILCNLSEVFPTPPPNLRSNFQHRLALPRREVRMSSGHAPHQRRASRSSKTGSSHKLQLNDSSTSSFPSLNNSQASLRKSKDGKAAPPRAAPVISPPVRGPRVASEIRTVAGVGSHGDGPNPSLSGLVCNVHRTTGKRPPGLSGATTTIVGDKLYVFGGQELSTRRIMRTMYELDLLRRHWTKIDTTGDLPSPRYFHSMCALGDTKLVLFGGSTTVPPGGVPSEKGTMPVAEIHMYDIHTATWSLIRTRNSPSPRYAHCATVLPSSAIFTSSRAPLSGLHHNPSSELPNQGTLGVEIDGRGGAEMMVIGGQFVEEQYTNTVDIFNFRSLTWTSSGTLDMHKCGAYRSVVATLSNMPLENIGAGIAGPGDQQNSDSPDTAGATEDEDYQASSAFALLYNNFNFLQPQVDVKIRHPDGRITDLEQRGQFSPPGLRFPTAGIIDHHLIVSGIFLRSSTEEYMLWALDLRTLFWHRIDVASGVFNSGSWNRGMPWTRRNTYVVLGDRSRPFKQDYEKRRLNFKNFAVIEMESFGLYDNPFEQSSYRPNARRSDIISDESLGDSTLGLIETSDMEIIAIDGEKIPVNSRLLAHRWGPYFRQLLSEDLGSKIDRTSLQIEPSALRPSALDSALRRISNVTITPNNRASLTSTTGSTLSNGVSVAGTNFTNDSDQTVVNTRPMSLLMKQPITRSRVLFLPHTYFTIRALLQYLYTSSLPPPSHHLCTPQILCSLLQIARPYRIEGLLEATVGRLHEVLDGKNTAAIFNAAAMAAGGGDAVKLSSDSSIPGLTGDGLNGSSGPLNGTIRRTESHSTLIQDDSETDVSVSTSSSMASLADVDGEAHPRIWSGDMSSVIGLQKRALRGLMEGKRMREQASNEDSPTSPRVGSP